MTSYITKILRCKMPMTKIYPSYIRTTEAPHVNPPPIASSTTISPGFNPAVANGDIKRQRNRGGRGIGVLINGQHNLGRIKPQFFGGCINDAGIGLMRHDPVDIRSGVKLGRSQRFVHHARQIGHGMTKNLAAFHTQFANGAGRRRPAIDIKQLVMLSIGVQPCGQCAACSNFAA